MRSETWLSALVATTLLFWFIGGITLGVCADPSTTSFGRSIIAVLDDENPFVRAQGWSFLGWLGNLSNFNPLHTETFKRVVRDDGIPLAQRMDGLLSRLRDKKLSPEEARAASSEFDALRNAALGVPEIAALLAASTRLDQSVPASDLDQIKQASTRVRPAPRPARLRAASAKETEALIAALGSRSPNDRDSRLDAANKITSLQLTAGQADALEPLAKDSTADIDLRRLLVLALIRNNRAPTALSFVDEQLLRPNATSEAGTYALEALTELAFADPVVARKAISERAQFLVPFLTDFEHFTNASAVLGRLSGDEVAKQISQSLTRRIELGTGLAGSACAYAVSLPRSPGIPVGLALFAGTERTRPDPANTAACILLLDPDTPASKHLRDLLVGKEAESRGRPLQALRLSRRALVKKLRSGRNPTTEYSGKFAEVARFSCGKPPGRRTAVQLHERKRDFSMGN